MIFIDTNVFLRSILRDTEEKAEACIKFFEKIDKGEIQAVTSLLVLNELLWVMEGLNIDKKEITKRLKAVVMSKLGLLGVKNGSIVLEALGYYEELGVDFIDALHSCIARENNIKKIVTYDEHFEKLEFVQKIEPEELISG